MRIRVAHTTRLVHDAPVREAFTELRLRPLDSGGQRCLSFELVTEPRAEVFHYRDRHGNDVRHFGYLPPHQELVVKATSEVLTPDGFGEAEAALSPLDRHDYLTPSAYAPETEAIRAFAAPHAAPDRPLASALALMAAIHAGLRYAPGSTDVHTTADEALAQGQGVCQDFAHLMLAAGRTLGIPGRYVSGYLHTTGNGGSATPPTTARRPPATCGWPSAAITPRCLPPAACTRAARRRGWRSTCAWNRWARADRHRRPRGLRLDFPEPPTAVLRLSREPS
jgi:transglutaminase-like putative cysteine protease